MKAVISCKNVCASFLFLGIRLHISRHDGSLTFSRERGLIEFFSRTCSIDFCILFRYWTSLMLNILAINISDNAEYSPFGVIPDEPQTGHGPDRRTQSMKVALAPLPSIMLDGNTAPQFRFSQIAGNLGMRFPLTANTCVKPRREATSAWTNC